jgi:formate dehydrogenase (coenzyme F420) beta subunit
MPDLKEIARTLLADGAVDVVIGYEAVEGGRTRPCFVRKPEDAGKLTFNKNAVNNLAVYLTKQKRPAGKVAIVAKGCDARAVTVLIQEQQLQREDVHIIGVECAGVYEQNGSADGAGAIAGKCIHCQVHSPAMYDTLVGEKESVQMPPDAGMARMQEVEALTPQDRFEYWTNELERCIRCYACRQVCPMCYCEQCIADKSTPQWIETSATMRGNLAWNLIRAFHLAGRCVGCNECERACPMDIPLSLLNRKMGMVARKDFNYAAGMDVNAPTLVGTYDKADRQDFIR